MESLTDVFSAMRETSPQCATFADRVQAALAEPNMVYRPALVEDRVADIDLCELATELERTRAARIISEVEALTDGRTDPFYSGFGMACEEIATRLNLGILETHSPHQIAQAVLDWWKDHQFDVERSYDGDGYCSEYNLYDDVPDMVVIARGIVTPTPVSPTVSIR